MHLPSTLSVCQSCERKTLMYESVTYFRKISNECCCCFLAFFWFLPFVAYTVKERNSAFTNKINSFSTIHDLSKDDENKTTTATTQPPQPSSPISKNGNIPTISPSIPSYNGKLEDISQHLFTRKRPTMQPTFKRNRGT